MTMRYRLGALIGSGGAGEVFRAQLEDGRIVAVKRLRAGRTSDPRHTERLVAEAATTASLKHPNIVRLYGVQRDQDDHISLVMELVEGVDLARLLRATRIPLNAAVYIVGALLRALDHAHENVGIVHRDVSPHNVLVSWDGEVKLSDFGLARAIGRGPTTGGLVRGKLHYLSPEQAQRAPLDGRSDLYAVGVVFYELLTGQLPYSGTEGEILGQLLSNQPFVPPHALLPELPTQLGDVTMRLLERDRTKRYQSAREALAALPDVQLGRAELVALLRELQAAGTVSGSPGMHNAKRRRRVRAALLAAGLLIAGSAITGVGVWAFRERPRAAAPAVTPVTEGHAAERREQEAPPDKPAPAAPRAGEQTVPAPAADRGAVVPPSVDARRGGPAPARWPRAPSHDPAPAAHQDIAPATDEAMPGNAPGSTQDAPKAAERAPTNPLWKEIEDEKDSDQPSWNELTSEE